MSKRKRTPKPVNGPWYSIEAAANGAEVRLFGEIGWEVVAKEFVEALDALGDMPLTVRINSVGGSVFEGLAIFNRLRSHKPEVVVVVEGIAASMASVIAMAADTVQMHAASMLMIHNPATAAFGDQHDHSKTADMLAKVREQLLDAYASRSSLSRAALADAMDAETWYTAAEAVEAGLADEVLDDELDMAACLRGLDLSEFSNLPRNLEAAVPKPKNPTAQPIDAQAEVQRRAVIEDTFRPFDVAGNPRLQAVKAALVADPSADINTVCEKLLEAVAASDQDCLPPAPARGGAIVTSNLSETFAADAADAIAARFGVPTENPRMRQFDRMGMVQIAEAMLRSRGTDTFGRSDLEIVNAAFSHGTDDFDSLLANVSNKFLQQGYESEVNTAAGWTRELSLPDFKQATIAQLSEASSLDEVGEHGEYEAGTLADAGETIQLSTYGKLLHLSRHAIVNDDLMAFSRLTQAQGAAARRKELDIVWGILTANGNLADGTALFDGARNNIGTSAALSVTSLGEARALMRKQTGLQGLQVLNIAPRFLLVPAALETDGEQLLSSLVDPSKTNDTSNPNWIRGLELVVDARLDEDSESQWYLAASPAQCDTIARAYLDGQTSAHLEQQDMFNRDGVSWKVRLDFAAVPVDFRGLVRNAGGS